MGLTDAEAWGEFNDWIKTEETRRLYFPKVRRFIEKTGFGSGVDAAGVPRGAAKVVMLARTRPDKLTGIIKEYMKEIRDSGLAAPISQVNFLSPVKTFLRANSGASKNGVAWRNVDWDKISKVLPDRPRQGADRAPKLEEIKKLLENCDSRPRAAILIMLSSGVRVGAFHFPKSGGGHGFMRFKDIDERKENGQVIAARLTVYPGEREQYTTFVTPEAWAALEAYRDDRRKHGEVVGPDSPVLRDKYVRIRDRGYVGAANKPKPLERDAIKSMISDLEKAAKVRPKRSGRSYEWKEVHGFRKWFKNRIQNPETGIGYAMSEIFMGHISSLANKGSYDKFAEEELFAAYKKAVPLLTISSDYNKPLAKEEEVEKLKKQLASFEERLFRIDMNEVHGACDFTGSATWKDGKWEVDSDVGWGKNDRLWEDLKARYPQYALEVDKRWRKAREEFDEMLERYLGEMKTEPPPQR